MTGPKLNEGNRRTSERTGYRAVARDVRISAIKVRPVLDLIRGKDVAAAAGTLSLVQRDAARDVRKLLDSAVANAVHNAEQDPAELFVRACFVDEGPTMKRFRPRAKGRAGAILKRSCHITIVLDTLSPEALEMRTLRAEVKGSARAASRASRVAASREKARAKQSDETAAETPVTETPVTETPVTEGEMTESTPEKGEEN
jgi:large subunit ribosomal protein L22